MGNIENGNGPHWARLGVCEEKKWDPYQGPPPGYLNFLALAGIDYGALETTWDCETGSLPPFIARQLPQPDIDYILNGCRWNGVSHAVKADDHVAHTYYATESHTMGIAQSSLACEGNIFSSEDPSGLRPQVGSNIADDFHPHTTDNSDIQPINRENPSSKADEVKGPKDKDKSAGVPWSSDRSFSKGTPEGSIKVISRERGPGRYSKKKKSGPQIVQTNML